MSIITTPEILERSNVVVSGAGRQAVVFLHGQGGDPSMWRLLAPAFKDR